MLSPTRLLPLVLIALMGCSDNNITTPAGDATTGGDTATAGDTTPAGDTMGGDAVPAETIAPITTAMPAGGIYTSAQSVTLSCADADSGCATTVYSTDGGPATTVYTGTITISGDTVLTFFSTDVAGNSETPQTESYVIDTTPPTVESITPADAATAITLDSPVVIVFSEALDPATITGATFVLTGPQGPLSAMLDLDPTTHTVTLIPHGRYAYDTAYTVTITTGVTDLAGNPLAATASATFTTQADWPTATSMIADASAQHDNLAMAFDSLGNGLAVWETRASPSSQILYSFYDAGSDSWSPEGTLGSGYLPQVACGADGDFMVVWPLFINNSRHEIQAQRVVDRVWHASTNISTSSVARTPAVSAGPGGYGAVWYQSGGTYYNIFANFYSSASSSWGTAEKIDDRAYGPSTWPQIASDGSGYTTAWIHRVLEGTIARDSAVVRMYDGADWDPQSTLLEREDGFVGQMHLASDGVSYATIWSQSYNIYASVWDGTSWQAVPSRLDTLAGDAQLNDLAAGDSGYMASWRQVDDAGFQSIYALQHDGASWLPEPVLLDVGDLSAGVPTVASNGTGYAIAWPQGDAQAESAYAIVHDGASWLGDPQLLEDSVYPVGDLTIVHDGLGGYVAGWVQPDDGTALATVHTAQLAAPGQTWNTPRSLVTTLRRSSADMPAMASNYFGEALLVWQQEDNGIGQLFGALYEHGAWGQPQLLLPEFDGDQPVVASSGDDFMLGWSDGDSMHVQQYFPADGVWGATTSLPDSYCTEMEDGGLLGSHLGYLLTCTTSDDQVNVRHFAADSWGPAQLVPFGDDSWEPRMAAGGNEYMVTWLGYDQGATSIFAATFTGTSWAGPAALLEHTDWEVESPSLAAGDHGFMAVWSQDNGSGQRVIMGSQYAQGQWQAEPQPVAAYGSSDAYYPQLAASGGGYGVVWKQDDQVEAQSIFFASHDGTSWQATADIIDLQAAEANDPLIASNGGGYSVVWTNPDGNGGSMFGRLHDGGSWSPDLLELGQDYTSYPYPVHQPFGKLYATVWLQADASQTADPFIRRVWSVMGW